jgi:hypothetical protein
MDARHGKVLYETPSGALRVLTLATHADAEVAPSAARGWLTLTGVVFDAGGTLYAWHNGATTPLGSATDVQVAGDYALRVGGGQLVVHKISTSGSQSLALPTSYTDDRVALLPNGDLYVAEPGALKRFSAGTLQTALADGKDRRGLVGAVTGVAYLRTLSTADTFRLSYWTGSAEVSYPRTYSAGGQMQGPGFQYSPFGGYTGSAMVANSGWVGWSEAGFDYTVNVKRSFLGGAAIASTFSMGANPVDIGPDGAVAVADGLHYLAALIWGSTRLSLPVPSGNETLKVRRPFVFEQAGRALYLVNDRVIQLDY